jgi:hypothetical protein
MTPETPPQPVPMVPLIYFNGFEMQYGSSDFSILLKVDSQKQVMLKASYTVGKTLSETLAAMVAEFERVTGHDVMTNKDVFEKMKADNEKQSNQ